MYSQQSHRNRRIALVVLDRTNRNTLMANIDLVLDALSRAVPGGYELVPIPPERKRLGGRVSIRTQFQRYRLCSRSDGMPEAVEKILAFAAGKRQSQSNPH